MTCIYMYKKRGEGDTGHIVTHGNENACKRKEHTSNWLIKQDGVGGRSILLMLRLPKKKKKK